MHSESLEAVSALHPACGDGTLLCTSVLYYCGSGRQRSGCRCSTHLRCWVNCFGQRGRLVYPRNRILYSYIFENGVPSLFSFNVHNQGKTGRESSLLLGLLKTRRDSLGLREQRFFTLVHPERDFEPTQEMFRSPVVEVLRDHAKKLSPNTPHTYTNRRDIHTSITSTWPPATPPTPAAPAPFERPLGVAVAATAGAATAGVGGGCSN